MDSSTLEQCPKFKKCTAPICPLDPDWHKRQHISGDRVCFYLLESQKPSAKPIFEVRSLGNLYEAMVRHAPAIAGTYSTIKTALDKAEATSSRMTRNVGAK